MSVMSDRFQRFRWSQTRISIDEMYIGHLKEFSLTEYNNARVSVSRLNDAYDGEKVFEFLGCRRGRPTVCRTK